MLFFQLVLLPLCSCFDISLPCCDLLTILRRSCQENIKTLKQMTGNTRKNWWEHPPQNNSTDLWTASIPQDLCLVDEQFGSSLGLHIVVSNLLKHHRAMFTRSVPVYNGVASCQVCILIKVHLFPYSVGVVQMSELLQDLWSRTYWFTY